MDALNRDHLATFRVDLRHGLIWVARALDYVGVDDVYHSHRVAYMAYQCALRLGWPEEKTQQAFFGGLIHDCGVSESREHLRLIKDMTPQNAEAHCIRGYKSLRSCPVLRRFATVVRYHHTHWDELQNLDLSQDDRDLAALVFLADRVDFLRARYISDCHADMVTLHEEMIAENVMAYSGSLFQPEMALAMCDLICTDGFWFAMDSDNIEEIGLRFESRFWLDQVLSVDDLIHLGIFLARIVDAKSPFTYQHSLKVAELSRYIADKLDLPLLEQKMIFIAGLVHDIGKLKTPDEILHKPGKLDESEYVRIKRHTIDTELALNKVFPNSKICEWASNHHERLDGSGYPNRKTHSELDVPSRIVAMADVFQALSQDRPYRGRMSLDEMLAIMEEMVTRGQLDRHIFALISELGHEMYQISTDSCAMPVSVSC